MIEGNRKYFRERHLHVIPRLKATIDRCRERGVHVIFANDSYVEDDWMFNFMEKHAIRGTDGVKVIKELDPVEGDIIVEKRRFSAFFRTDLDITLKELQVDTLAVAGINTHVCVLSTIFDAISLNFNTILLEDCCASPREDIDRFIFQVYGRYLPGLKVLSSDEFLNLLESR